MAKPPRTRNQEFRIARGLERLLAIAQQKLAVMQEITADMQAWKGTDSSQWCVLERKPGSGGMHGTWVRHWRERTEAVDYGRATATYLVVTGTDSIREAHIFNTRKEAEVVRRQIRHTHWTIVLLSEHTDRMKWTPAPDAPTEEPRDGA